MKFVIVDYIRGRWVWLRIVLRANTGETLKQPSLEWTERHDATVFETREEAHKWAPPGSSSMPETWAPRRAKMGS